MLNSLGQYPLNAVLLAGTVLTPYRRICRAGSYPHGQAIRCSSDLNRLDVWHRVVCALFPSVL